MPTFESVAAQVKKEIATERARAKVNEIQNKMEDERSGGANVVEASQKLGLTPVTIDAVDRSGRLPNGQPVTNIPRGLDVVSQAFNSDVGVDNEPIQFAGGYVWYDVLGITPSRERTLDEVRGEVEAKWREDQISSKLRAKATEMVQKLEHGGTLAEVAASAGLKVDTAAGFRRDASLPGVPSAAITAAFRTPKGRPSGKRRLWRKRWIVFPRTDSSYPQGQTASVELKVN
jgi:peptidyl-prolyl cis-trans isomerase D